MAAGFAESYVRLWSLKGEKLKGLRSDFSSSAVKDGQSNMSTRKGKLLMFRQHPLYIKYVKRKAVPRESLSDTVDPSILLHLTL